MVNVVFNLCLLDRPDLGSPTSLAPLCENTGASDLRFAYVFPASSFGEVEYVFDE